MTRREILLVGIRANSKEPEPIRQFTHNASYRIHTLSPFGGRRSECDPPTHNGSYQRLVEIGLRWDHSTNLLPGLPNSKATFNKDDVVAGRLMVDRISQWARTEINQGFVDRIDPVLLGANVCRCFGLPFEPINSYPSELGTIFVLPHPSGLNRWWNDPQNLSDAKRFCCDIVTDYGNE